jgi:hypothetical protein
MSGGYINQSINQSINRSIVTDRLARIPRTRTSDPNARRYVEAFNDHIAPARDPRPVRASIGRTIGGLVFPRKVGL